MQAGGWLIILSGALNQQGQVKALQYLQPGQLCSQAASNYTHWRHRHAHSSKSGPTRSSRINCRCIQNTYKCPARPCCQLLAGASFPRRSLVPERDGSSQVYTHAHTGTHVYTRAREHTLHATMRSCLVAIWPFAGPSRMHTTHTSTCAHPHTSCCGPACTVFPAQLLNCSGCNVTRRGVPPHTQRQTAA